MIVLVLLFAVASVHAADSGTVIANTPLLERPDGQGKGTLLANTLVEIEERRGGWYRVTATGGRTGWVRIGAIRLAGQAEQSDSVFSGLWGWLNSGRSMQSGQTATAGMMPVISKRQSRTTRRFDASTAWQWTPPLPAATPPPCRCRVAASRT